jgi:transposase-like protein
MTCPNCNSDDLQKIEKTSRKTHIDRGFNNSRYICLKCGYTFSQYIEKRYGNKNL